MKLEITDRDNKIKDLESNTSSNSKELNTELEEPKEVPTEKVNQDKSSSEEENTDKDSSVVIAVTVLMC